MDTLTELRHRLDVATAKLNYQLSVASDPADTAHLAGTLSGVNMVRDFLDTALTTSAPENGTSLHAFATDTVAHGMRADVYPTIRWGTSAEIVAWYNEYLSGIDKRLREGARQALEGAYGVPQPAVGHPVLFEVNALSAS